MHRGLFITFEGIDGCGKSTQSRMVAQTLTDRGIAHILTREPGGTPLAEKIRGIILDAAHGEMTNACEVLLYLAARAQHVSEKILPALEHGRVVLCDRFSEATYAYQGFGRGIPLKTLNDINTYATAGLVPDHTFIFDLTVEEACARMQTANKALDRLEKNPPAFHEKIRQGYHTLAQAQPGRITLLNGMLKPEELCALVVDRVTAMISDRGMVQKSV